MLAGAGRHLHSSPPLAVDDRYGPVAQRRSRTLRIAFHRRDPTALHSHLAGHRSQAQHSRRHLLPAAHGFFGQAGLGAERRRLSDARASSRRQIRRLIRIQPKEARPWPTNKRPIRPLCRCRRCREPQKMLDPIPLSALDANGKLTDDTKKVIDLIADADIILAGGHLPASELHILFDEAARRGVKKMMVNHPTYIVGCSDADIRQLVARGVKMEHSICMFIEGKSLKYSPDDLAHLIEVAGVDNTILSSDLGLQGSQRPVDGFRSITQILLDLQMPRPAIRKLISDNAARFLNLPVSQSAAQDAA